MKRIIFNIMAFLTIVSLGGCNSTSDPSAWSDKQTETWFAKGEWHGSWNKTPDASINKKELAQAYYKNKERWDKAFNFLAGARLDTMSTGRHDIDGNNLYVSISDYNTKAREEARFEAHEKYIDIQYVASGTEFMGLAPAAAVDSVLQTYDPAKDIKFVRVTGSSEFKADPGRFFIFFPSDMHRPGLADGEKAMVRKVVVKVKVD
ncbi:MAG: YhcH/YjgK/YiaL family protein [Bacteroidales bacterium]